MTDETAKAVARIIAASARVTARALGMNAANLNSIWHGFQPAYDDLAFDLLIAEEGLAESTVRTTLQE